MALSRKTNAELLDYAWGERDPTPLEFELRERLRLSEIQVALLREQIAAAAARAETINERAKK